MSVTVLSRAFSDPRFAVFGRLCGLPTKWAARWGRATCEELWAHCTEIERYELSPAVVDVVAGVDGAADHLVTAGLGESRDGVVYIKGTKGKIEWLPARRAAAEAGGAATRAKWEAKREANRQAKRGPNEGQVAGQTCRPTQGATATATATVKDPEETQGVSGGAQDMDTAPDPAAEILAHLNTTKACAPVFRPTEGNLRGIRARLAAGATPEDCRAVIDAKVAEWGGRSDMRKNLNPETLFRAGHWDRYLDEARAAAAPETTVLRRRLRSDLDSIGAPPEADR